MDSADKMNPSYKSLAPAPLSTSLISQDPSGNSPTTPIVFAVPSLRGKLVVEQMTHTFRGLWAISDAAHDIPGQASEFEFQLMCENTIECTIPMSGKYHGWFMLQQPAPKHPLKIEDKEINIHFGPFCELTNLCNIEGEGYNKFGKFAVHGSLAKDGTLQMYRTYAPKTSLLSGRSKKSLKSPIVGSSACEKVVTKNLKPKTPRGVTPRESTSRSLKEGSYGADSIANISSVPVIHRAVKRGRPTSPESGDSVSGLSMTSAECKSVSKSSKPEIPRTPRISQKLLKCSELLKDLCRQSQAVWFKEPVDYIKLKIPDYPKIVMQPMDFSTVRGNLEKGVYKSPNDFADHVRLIFKNAISYNTLRDNPVHIAARELSNRFEEKFRIMCYSSFAADSNPELMKKKKIGCAVRAAKRVQVPGALVSELPPPAIDSNLHTIMELQRQMSEMQNEITQLRNVVRHSDVKGSSHRSSLKSLDLYPETLTLEEKRSLISTINKLPPEKMSKVVDIIQSAISTTDRDDDGEVEIPLDELDVKTLRRLQDYVESIYSSKRKKVENVEIQRQNGIKKPRKKSKILPGCSATLNSATTFGNANNTCEQKIFHVAPAVEGVSLTVASSCEVASAAFEEPKLVDITGNSSLTCGYDETVTKHVSDTSHPLLSNAHQDQVKMCPLDTIS